MATWVTHLMIADRIMAHYPQLDRRGFCVGNIAPDCNIENEDWSAFTPPREVTHWMTGERKTASDCDGFYRAYILNQDKEALSGEHYSFLLGYYSHLLTDAAFQKFIRDEDRVKAVWRRIKGDTALYAQAKELPENWDSVKKLIGRQQRMNEIYSMEAEYLRENPGSGYLTEIVPLKEFPDYIDYLPHGCIVRKIGVMGFIPRIDEALGYPVTLSKAEFQSFANDTTALIIDIFRERNLI